MKLSSPSQSSQHIRGQPGMQKIYLQAVIVATEMVQNLQFEG